MRSLILALFLLAILSFPSPRVRIPRSFFFAVPILLAALFCTLAAASSAFSIPLALMILAYCLAPALVAWFQGPNQTGRPTWLDFAIILLLWLPLEFSLGAGLIPRPAQGFLHSVAYGIAILLGLTIFLSFRAMPGLKYNLPRARDIAYGCLGFIVTAPILIAVGRALNFMPPFHLPAHPTPGGIALTCTAIFFGTALPEEILFRSLIQNWLMQRYGFTTPMLLVAGLIFGAAHLDNGPQPLPNWRYMILATIAGVAYGQVFRKSSSVFSSITFHALVDAAKHIFF